MVTIETKCDTEDKKICQLRHVNSILLLFLERGKGREKERERNINV